LPLTPPPRDANGKVLPHDHPEISNDDGVIRRVAPNQWVYDPKVLGRRVSTAVFRASTGPNSGMSVDLQKLIEEAGLNAKEFVATPRWNGAVRFTASELRGEGLLVGYDPIQGENEYHGEVWGNFTRSVQKRLVSMAKTFVPPKD
jgi:hypothetical protein